MTNSKVSFVFEASSPFAGFAPRAEAESGDFLGIEKKKKEIKKIKKTSPLSQTSHLQQRALLPSILPLKATATTALVNSRLFVRSSGAFLRP